MTDKDIDFLILVEHTARELDIACLIKYLLEQKGSSVEIRSLPYYDKHSMREKRVRVLVVPYCYSLGIYASIIPQFSNIIMLNLAYEQIFQNINENLKAPKDEFAKKFVHHHAWSQNFFDYLTRYGVEPTNIFINGNMSYALYKNPYKHYFPNREELADKYHLDASKKWVFIPENYGAAFYSDNIIDEKIKKGIDPSDVIKYREFATQSLKKIIQWCVTATKYCEVEIIFRPRPATSYEKMQDFFHVVIPEIPQGLHIIKECTVKEWILASDIVMSSYSTTLIEAAIAEKPIAMLEPLPFPEYLNAIWYRMVPKIEQTHEFTDTILSPSPDSYLPLKNWAESGMMSKGDPIQGIIDLMIRIKNNGIHVPESYTIKNDKFFIQSLKHKGEDHLSYIAYRLFKRQPTTNEDYENDLFSDKDIAQRIRRWEVVLNKIY